MSIGKKTNRETKRDLLFDHLMEVEYSTWPEMADAIGVTSRGQVYKAVRDLRLFLAEFPAYTVTADAVDPSEPWHYSLATTMEQAQGWAENRLSDAETRLETIEAVSHAVASVMDGRSVGGRKANKINKVVSRLIEDLAEISE